MIAVIDNFDSFVFNLVRYIKDAGFQVEVMRNNEINADILEEADGILLSPGPGIPEEAGNLMQVLTSYSQRKPILGVCLGHQAIAQHFGGKLRCMSAPVHGKASEISVNVNSQLYREIAEKIEVGRYHSWCVDEEYFPKELNITSRLGTNEIMSLEHLVLPIFGVQFHPESILTPQGRTIINNWLKTISS